MMYGMASRGELEQRVMELLWSAREPQSVADVQAELGKERTLAYTTVMTVLDRLAKKGLVTRERVERAWQYQAAESQSMVLSREIAEKFDGVPPEVRLEALKRLGSRLTVEERAALAAGKE